MSSPFRFKKFAVRQDLCAMKVGTDGVLLGAWARLPEGALNILDIGTGTGVIALVLAQRFSQSNVLGIDIDVGAVAQAEENFRNSPFSSRLRVKCVDFQKFESSQQFDFIVSNPPFFTNGILPKNEQRKLARHTTDFSFEGLFDKVRKLLSPSGIFSMIIPKSEQEKLVQIAMQYGLYVREVCVVYPNSERPAKRVLLAFSCEQNQSVIVSDITIETEQRHHYTGAYKSLLKDFYLAF